jgi:beta-lactamase regulating signal transducer with metallopeptidase domain
MLERCAASWCDFVSASLIDGSVALLLALIGWSIIKRWSAPQVGCWLFAVVLLKIALPWTPSFEMERPAWWRAVPSLRSSASPDHAVVRTLDHPAAATDPETVQFAVSRLAAAPGLLWPCGAWAVIAAFLLLRIVWLVARGRRLIARSVMAADAFLNFGTLKQLAGVSSHVELRISDDIDSPAACGLLRPCVLVPRSLVPVFSADEFRWILLHELFHIRRADLWLNLGEAIMRARFFFHPVVWIACRMISTLRERACDDAAVFAGGMSPARSAKTFLRLVEWISTRPRVQQPFAGLALFHDKQQIKKRLMKLNDSSLQRRRSLGWRGQVTLVALSALIVPSLRPAELRADEAAELRAKIAELEKRLSTAEQTQGKERQLERLREENKQKARKRAAEDSRHYKREELQEIESLYQVANKNWRTDEARESLKKLLAKYDKANRTGCATLYMGQLSEGAERREYLTRAVEKFSDCFYFDGCQVGGYGRYVLAITLWQEGAKDKARELLDEITKNYKGSIDHRGRPMVDLVEAVQKELGITKG